MAAGARHQPFLSPRTRRRNRAHQPRHVGEQNRMHHLPLAIEVLGAAHLVPPSGNRSPVDGDDFGVGQHLQQAKGEADEYRHELADLLEQVAGAEAQRHAERSPGAAPQQQASAR